MLVFLVLLTNKLDSLDHDQSSQIRYFSVCSPLYLTFFTLIIGMVTTSFFLAVINQVRYICSWIAQLISEPVDHVRIELNVQGIEENMIVRFTYTQKKQQQTLELVAKPRSSRQPRLGLKVGISTGLASVSPLASSFSGSARVYSYLAIFLTVSTQIITMLVRYF